MFVIRNSPSATYMAAILIALVILSAAAVADAHADLMRVSTAFHEGLREGNATALAVVLDDRFTWTQADGIVQSKSDLLERLRWRCLISICDGRNPTQCVRLLGGFA